MSFLNLKIIPLFSYTSTIFDEAQVIALSSLFILYTPIFTNYSITFLLLFFLYLFVYEIPKIKMIAILNNISKLATHPMRSFWYDSVKAIYFFCINNITNLSIYVFYS